MLGREEEQGDTPTERKMHLVDEWDQDDCLPHILLSVEILLKSERIEVSNWRVRFCHEWLHNRQHLHVSERQRGRYLQHFWDNVPGRGREDGHELHVHMSGYMELGDVYRQR